MYSARLKQKPEYSNLKQAINQVNKYRDMQLHNLENVKKEIELRNAKGNSILLRKKLVEHQNKLNYTNELDRIRGELSRHENRFPIGTKERLEARAKHLREMGAKDIAMN